MIKKFLIFMSMIYFFIFKFVVGEAQDKQNLIYTPILTFSEEETGKNWFANPWGGGECKVERVIDEKEERFKAYLRVSFKEAQMTLSNPKLFEKISLNWKEKPVHGFYFWIRFTGEHTDRIYMEYLTFSEGKNYNYSNRLPVIPGNWQKIEIPIGGFPVGEHTHPFDIKELKQIYIIVYKASGILDIGEIGIIQKYNQMSSFKTKELEVPFFTEEIKIDGKVESKEWFNSAEIKLRLPEEEFLCSDKKPQEETKILLEWNKEGIFIGAIMEKKSIKKLKANFIEDTTEIWKDECLELYFLPPGKTRNVINLRKYAINANGKIGPHHFWRDKDKGYRVSAKKYTDRWELEFFLPWKCLDIIPEETPFLFFNATRTTYDGEKIEERTGWTTTKWDGLFDFGILYLLQNKEGLTKHTTKDIIFGRVETGYYFFKGKTDIPTNYIIWIFSSKELVYTKKGFLKEGDFVIPLNIEVKETDNYYVQFLTYTEKGIDSFFEARFPEAPEISWKRLPIDAIAIFPEPKQIELKDNKKEIKDGTKYYLTSKEINFCGDILKEELEKFYGISLKSVDNLKDADIILDFNLKGEELKNLLKMKNLLGEFEKIKFDGYLLNVDGDKIIVTAKEKRGVLYGTNVLLDLIKMTTGEIGPPVYVKYCKVVDWPDFKIRFWTDWLSDYRPAVKIPVELYISMIEKIPLKFRYNGFGIFPSDYYHWECAPGMRLKQGWTPDEFRKLIKFLNERYTPLIPAILGAHGHADEWLLNHPEYKYLCEDGVGSVICTKNPDTYKVLFGFFDELIKITSENPEYKSEYFIVGLDEVRWQTFNVPPEKRCKYCSGIPKNQIFLEHIYKLNDYLKEKGYRLVMSSDMLVEEHNGLNEFQCALIRDKLPKDIVMAHWSILDYPSIPRFKELGMENWKLDTSYRLDRLNEEMITGRGFGVYTYNWHLTITRAKTGVLYGPIAQALYANASWNIFPDNNDSTWRKYERIYGKFLLHNWSRKPLLFATKEIKPIDMSEIVNTPVIDKNGDGWFGLGEKFDLSLMDFSIKEIDGIPVKFAFRNNIPMCLKLKEKSSSANIKINSKISSLIFLHTAHIDDKDLNSFVSRENYKDNPEGLPIVKYTIKYKDGTSTYFTINLGWNISLWKIDPLSKNSVFSKYIVDTRSLWEGHTKYGKEKNLPPDIAIYQYEWVNPYPEKEVESILVEKSSNEPSCDFVSYALLSISYRGVK